MLLCINIGNTNVALGLYEGDTRGARWRLATDHERMPDEYALQVMGLLGQAGIPSKSVDCVVLASVVPPLTARWVQLCRNYLGCDPLVVTSQVRTGVTIRYDDPGAVGADRIANAVAAYRLYGGPACTVDFGTATTFDAINAAGDYLGGAIAPGIGIAADALFLRTSKLQRVELVRPPAAIGRNTIHAIQSGLIFGYVGLVEGMVARFKTELGPETHVIATGGLSEIIAKETPVIQVVAPWLTLEGLHMIYEMNR
jgi:type III pantothenate kinase